jgi:hypothetical protein
MQNTVTNTHFKPPKACTKGPRYRLGDDEMNHTTDKHNFMPAKRNVTAFTNTCSRSMGLAIVLVVVGLAVPATAARYWITFFVFSVLPAPDSPLSHDTRHI